MTVTPQDVLVAVVALALGHLAGSLPVSAWVGRSAGVDVRTAGDGNPGAANVWQAAGPGWGLLALSGDLAKGALPVSIGVVTWSWGAGWAAALGAVVGASWPLLGRSRGGRGIATFSGTLLALAPPAGLLELLVAAAIAAIGRLAGRNARVAAISVAVGTYPLAFLIVRPDPGSMLALLALYLVALARWLATRRGGAAAADGRGTGGRVDDGAAAAPHPDEGERRRA